MPQSTNPNDEKQLTPEIDTESADLEAKLEEVKKEKDKIQKK